MTPQLKHWKNKTKGFVVRQVWVELQPLPNLTMSPWLWQFILSEPWFPLCKTGRTEPTCGVLGRMKAVKEHVVLIQVPSTELS